MSTELMSNGKSPQQEEISNNREFDSKYYRGKLADIRRTTNEGIAHGGVLPLARTSL